MSFATWIAFVIAGSLIAISPGSGAVLSMSHGLAYGLKKASATVLGLQFGLILGAGFTVFALRRRTPPSAAPLSAEEQARLDRLMREDAP